MAADVEATWLQIIAQQGHLSPADAQQYLKNLRLNGRYQKDVY
jgi:sulfite reductase (NADPH) flavoprotein alpha-component